ncbi:hypothetical protein B0T18DRAFT_404925 [Schizothecium vesticola]|uniref:Uncharacterized protein n=1 Tax=Schizothecium vesticola TaxID=314040 RepID=A0AA40KB52_9PEZI|nr:hypothetical protein B0T18DRAFT_404925 [Schizothecium vesticola]
MSARKDTLTLDYPNTILTQYFTARQYSSDEFEQLMERHNLTDPQREHIREAVPRAIQQVVQDTSNNQINNGADIWRSTRSHMLPDGGEGLVAQQLSMWLADNWQSLAPELKRLKEEAALKFLEMKLKVQEWWKKLCEIVGDIVIGVVLPLLKTTVEVLGAAAVGTTLGLGVMALAAANPIGAIVVGGCVGIATLANSGGSSARRRRRRRR